MSSSKPSGGPEESERGSSKVRNKAAASAMDNKESTRTDDDVVMASNTNTKKRPRPPTLMKICLTSMDGKRQIIGLSSSSELTLEYLRDQACQMLGISSSTRNISVSLKHGVRPPYKELTEDAVSQLSHLDRIYVEVVQEKESSGAALPAAAAAVAPSNQNKKKSNNKNEVVDLTADSSDEEEEESNDDDSVQVLDVEKEQQHHPESCSIQQQVQQHHGGGVPFGTFTGTDVYRNRIVDEQEFWTDGHFTIDELVLPGTTSAIVTTFVESPGSSFNSSYAEYLESVFGSSIPNLMVVKPSSKQENPQAVIGHGVLTPMLQQQEERRLSSSSSSSSSSRRQRQWYYVETRPHTEGCLHAKLFLFRSPRGLRLVVSGNNLVPQQQKGQRDIFWVQDFPTSAAAAAAAAAAPLKTGDHSLEKKARAADERRRSQLPWEMGSSSNDEEDDYDYFAMKLYNFLRDVTECAKTDDHTIVLNHLSAVLDGIDFSSHKADLVVSLPRPKDDYGCDRGGYQNLAKVVRNQLKKKGIKEGASSSSSSSPSSSSGEDSSTSSIVYSYSGALGNLRPDFLLQMHQAMNGRSSVVTEKKAAQKTDWGSVEDVFRVFWPSTEMACQMDIAGLHCLRHMPNKHIATIPDSSLRKVFQEAIPNPPNKIATRLPGSTTQAPSSDKFYVTTHGKFLWNERKDDDGGGCIGILYIGSHNLSSSAWGERKGQPKNVEVGVVLISKDLQQQKCWKQRFPCQGAASSSKSATYRLYAGKGDLKEHPDWPRWEAFEQGQMVMAQMPTQSPGAFGQM